MNVTSRKRRSEISTQELQTSLTEDTDAEPLHQEVTEEHPQETANKETTTEAHPKVVYRIKRRSQVEPEIDFDAIAEGFRLAEKGPVEGPLEESQEQEPPVVTVPESTSTPQAEATPRRSTVEDVSPHETSTATTSVNKTEEGRAESAGLGEVVRESPVSAGVEPAAGADQPKEAPAVEEVESTSLRESGVVEPGAETSSTKAQEGPSPVSDEKPAKASSIFGKSFEVLTQTLEVTSSPFGQRPVENPQETKEPEDIARLQLQVTSPSIGHRPATFPGEEEEDAEFCDFNCTLLKFQSSPTGIGKFQPQAQGCFRLLKSKSDPGSRRLVFRQTGTWQLFLNSPLEYVSRVEPVTTTASKYLLKFMAINHSRVSEDEPPLAMYAVLFPELTQREDCSKLLSRN